MHAFLRVITMCVVVLCGNGVPRYVDPSAKTCELMHPAVQEALKEDLKDNNCLSEVEIVTPAQVERARKLFYRDGFVVISDILGGDQLTDVKDTCTNIANNILERDPNRLGNRGPFRYSFGPPHKTGHILHYPEIAQLVDLPTLTPVLKAIFGNDKYLVRGARGDFNLPGAPYQALHADMSYDYLIDPATTEFPDSGRLNFRDLPVFYVVANFVLSNLTALNAPIRQIPMTHQVHRPMPMLDDEPLWMKRSTLCPVPAGAVILRDPRAWHAGTPNLSEEIRLMPNVEYYSYWYRFKERQLMTHSMPREVFDTLTPFGQRLCREVVVPPGEELDTSMREDIPYIFEDVLPCYYHMGFTDEDLKKVKSNGEFYTPYEGTYRYGFYGRLNSTVTV